MTSKFLRGQRRRTTSSKPNSRRSSASSPQNKCLAKQQLTPPAACAPTKIVLRRASKVPLSHKQHSLPESHDVPPGATPGAASCESRRCLGNPSKPSISTSLVPFPPTPRSSGTATTMDVASCSRHTSVNPESALEDTNEQEEELFEEPVTAGPSEVSHLAEMKSERRTSNPRGTWSTVGSSAEKSLHEIIWRRSISTPSLRSLSVDSAKYGHDIFPHSFLHNGRRRASKSRRSSLPDIPQSDTPPGEVRKSEHKSKQEYKWHFNEYVTRPFYSLRKLGHSFGSSASLLGKSREQGKSAAPDAEETDEIASEYKDAQASKTEGRETGSEMSSNRGSVDMAPRMVELVAKLRELRAVGPDDDEESNAEISHHESHYDQGQDSEIKPFVSHRERHDSIFSHPFFRLPLARRETGQQPYYEPHSYNDGLSEGSDSRPATPTLDSRSSSWSTTKQAVGRSSSGKKRRVIKPRKKSSASGRHSVRSSSIAVQQHGKPIIPGEFSPHPMSDDDEVEITYSPPFV